MRPRSIAPSVELFATRTPTLPPATHTNSFALGTHEVLLVEPATPFEDEQRAFIEWVRAMPSQGRYPVAILLTHHHVDHVGAADVFPQALGLPLWAHRETMALLPERHFDRALSDGDELVLDGPVPERWRVLHTPGHARDHVCLHNATSSVLVAGDMVSSVSTVVIPPSEGGMAAYLTQLERLEALDVALMLPAHGDPISRNIAGMPSPTDVLRGFVAHRLAREVLVVRALEATPGGSSLTALLPVVYADPPRTLFPYALASLTAHLDKLVAEGRAVQQGSTYRPGTVT